MDKFKRDIIYYLIIIASFYLLPFVIQDTGSAMVVLLILIPVSVFIVSLVFSLKNGFKLYFSLLVGLLFIPTIYIHYNESAWIYTVIYTLTSVIAQGLAILTKR
ncbi:MAG: exosortase [Clostridiales bacterium]|nr:MAG: exosortase [Clostridiales bacterium]